MSTITFVYPSRILGGAELLFLRLGKTLVEQGQSVAYVDYEDGYCAQQIKEQRLPIQLIVKGKGAAKKIPPGIIIMPISSFFRYPRLARLNESHRLLFWTLHPNNLHDVCLTRPLSQLPRLYRWILQQSLSHYLCRLIAANALLVMDKTNAVRNLSIAGLQPDFNSLTALPIATELPDRLPDRLSAPVERKSLKLLWLGRLADGKGSVLARFIESLNQVLENNPRGIELTIVGDGAEKPLVKEAVEYLHRTQEISINWQSRIEPNELSHFVAQRTHLGLAMGTSAMDLAKLGIPTLYLELPESLEYDPNRWVWVKDLHHELCADIGQFDSPSPRYSLGQILDQVYDAKTYQALQSAHAETIAAQFGLETVARQLQEAAQKTQWQAKQQRRWPSWLKAVIQYQRYWKAPS